MNRKNLTAAVLAGLAGAAGIAGTAQAVNLNPDGLGQVLVYPYYTVNGGNLTTLSVVNTSEDAKAVKVRFLEGQNSIEVLDFNLYLSAYDVWTAAIVDSAGTPTLVIEDRTCTVPDLVRDFGGSQAFLTYGLNDGGSDDISRTREGHFEMIEMGTVVDDSATAATHVDGEPADCASLVAAWTTGPDGVSPFNEDSYWVEDPLEDIESVSGGLFGGAAIVNPLNGTMYSYDARAINDYNQGVLGNDFQPLHGIPGTTRPSLNNGNQFDGHVFTDQGDTADAEFNRSVDAVSFVFMHDAIMNEYATGGDLNGSSEWVLTFPTKNFYVDVAEAPVAPFVSEWSDNDDDGVNDGACEPVFLDTIWDQEEDSPSPDPTQPRPPVVSPAPPTEIEGDEPFLLCYETNIIRFGADPGAETEVLGSTNFTNIDNESLGFNAGWARIDLFAYPDDFDDDGVFDGINFRPYLGSDHGSDGAQAYGLPVTGFWVFQAQNGFLGDGEDVLANYGGLWNHKATKCFSGEFCRFDDSALEAQ
ncbi:MAG: hypothetical protein HKN58_10765 [Xanthomonadales bacterium]|nr:hypothetical protein [Xanthomonadales bacterium]